MTDAHGSDVKVYLYLLRCLQDPSVSISIESVAQALDETEKDIRTSIKYWDKQHVLSVHYYRDGRIKSITVHDLDEVSEEESDDSYAEDTNIALLSAGRPYSKEPAPEARNGRPYGRRADDEPKAPARSSRAAYEPQPPIQQAEIASEKGSAPEPKEKPSYSMQMIQSFRNDYPDFDELIDYVENALGKTLSPKDLQTISFIFEELSFPTDLIRFLYDYCIEKGKKASSYIEKVAREWHSKGISTIEGATQDIDEFTNRFAVIKTAFGINRPLLDAELKYANKWFFEYALPDEMIKSACDRTVINTSKTDFRYADKILSDWHSKGYKSLEEAESSESFPSGSYRGKTVQRNCKKTSDYTQRNYTPDDFAALEKKKLGIKQ